MYLRRSNFGFAFEEWSTTMKSCGIWVFRPQSTKKLGRFPRSIHLIHTESLHPYFCFYIFSTFKKWWTTTSWTISPILRMILVSTSKNVTLPKPGRPSSPLTQSSGHFSFWNSGITGIWSKHGEAHSCSLIMKRLSNSLMHLLYVIFFYIKYIYIYIILLYMYVRKNHV